MFFNAKFCIFANALKQYWHALLATFLPYIAKCNFLHRNLFVKSLKQILVAIIFGYELGKQEQSVASFISFLMFSNFTLVEDLAGVLFSALKVKVEAKKCSAVSKNSSLSVYQEYYFWSFEMTVL